MNLRQIVPLFIAVAMFGLIAGCSVDANHDPVITGITATPSGQVRPNESVILQVAATDEDGDQLTFTWSATGGQLSAVSGDNVTWTAPASAQACIVSVVCSDGLEGHASADQPVDVRAWMTGYASAVHDDSVYVPNPGIVDLALEWEEQVGSNALVDSAFVSNLELEPDSLEGDAFQIWAVTPTGSRILLWDRLSGQPELIDTRIQGIAGQAANGTWKISVSREAKGLECCVDDAEVEVYYRY